MQLLPRYVPYVREDGSEVLVCDTGLLGALARFFGLQGNTGIAGVIGPAYRRYKRAPGPPQDDGSLDPADPSGPIRPGE